MRAAFKEKGGRTEIDLAGLQEIYARQFGYTYTGRTKDELKAFIRKFGKCECSKTCKTPLNGKCQWDHKYLHAASTEGDVIDWRAVIESHHKEKSKRDNFHIRKLKKTAEKYNPDYAPEPDPWAKPTQKVAKRADPWGKNIVDRAKYYD